MTWRHGRLEASACTTSSAVFLARNCSTGTKLQAARFGEDFKTTKSGRRLFGTQNTNNSFGWSLKTRHTRHTAAYTATSTYFPFRQKQLERVHFFEVATSGNLWSAVLQAWINESRNQRRQMCQHNFSARLTHWSAGFAIRCVHCLVRYIQEKQSKMARYWIVCKHASICFPNSHIYCVIWGIDMDGTGTLQTGPSQVVARDQEVFSRLGLESPLTFLNPQIFDVHVKMIFDFSGLCIRCLPCISQLLDGRWTASAFGVRPGRQQCSNVSLNLGLFRWNGWMDEFVLDMCLNLEDMTCRSSRVRWVPKFCTEFASWMLNPRQPSRPWSYQKFSMIYIYIYIHTIMFNLKVC